MSKHCIDCGAALQIQIHNEEERLGCSNNCGYVFWNNPVPVVAGLVKYDGKIILIQNTGWPLDWFGLVTGYLEKNETPEEGIVREVREELGLESKVVSLIGNYIFTQKNEIILAYYLTAEGNIQTNDEIQDFKLVLPNKLKPWPFATGLAAEQWLKNENLIN